MHISNSAALFGLAVPCVLAQTLDFASIVNLPLYTPSIDSTATAQTVPYNPTSAASSIAAEITSGGSSKREISTPEKRQDTSCAPQPLGSGPVPANDTAAAFECDPDFANYALNATTPAGYTATYINLNCSSNAYGYMGFQNLDVYDVEQCSALCDSTTGCMAFNIYFERDPTVAPGPGCDNPPSTTNIKCVLWGGPVNTDNANNCGQWRDDFEVVIAGSNGYVNNTLEPCPGWTGPTPLGSCAINAPNACNGTYNTYIGTQIFTGVPFDPALCEAACEATSAYDLSHPTPGQMPMTCQFFNTFILLENGTAVGQYCAMYTQAWDSSYATNCGQWNGATEFTIECSYTYTNSTTPSEGCPSVSSSTTSSVSSTVSSSSSSSSTPCTTTSSQSSVSSSPSPSSTPCTTSTTSSKSSSTPCTTSTTSSKSSSTPCTTTTSSKPISTPCTTSKQVSSSSSSKPCTTLSTSTKSSSASASKTSSTCTYAASASPCSTPQGQPTCNQKGYNFFSSVVNQASGSQACPSQDLCAWYCLNQTGCGSFAWEASSQSCVLFSEKTQESSGLWGWMDWVMNDCECYEWDCSNGGSPYPSPPGPSPKLPFLSSCVTDSQCECGRCLNFNQPKGICI